MSSGVRASASGSFVSNGSAKTISTPGWQPGKVEVRCSGGDRGDWFASMPDGHVSKITAAGAVSHATSNGITPTATGFTLGADADLNANGETVYWHCEESTAL